MGSRLPPVCRCSESTRPCWRGADDQFDFPTLMKIRWRPCSTPRVPQGIPRGLLQPPSAGAAYPGTGHPGGHAGQSLLRSDDVYMPITPCFTSMPGASPMATMLGGEAGLSGALQPDKLVRDSTATRGEFLPLCADHLADDPRLREPDRLRSRGGRCCWGQCAAARAGDPGPSTGSWCTPVFGMSRFLPAAVRGAPDRGGTGAAHGRKQLPLRIRTGKAIGLVDFTHHR